MTDIEKTGISVSAEDTAVSPAFSLLRIIGNPFISGQLLTDVAGDPHKLLDLAGKNKVLLPYLEALHKQKADSELLSVYNAEKARYSDFIDEVSRVSILFDNSDIDFTLYKTIKAFPVVPGDIDLIIFGGKSAYRKSAEVLLRAGYNLDLEGVINPEMLTRGEYEKAAGLSVKATYRHEHISPESTNFRDPRHNIIIDLRKQVAVSHVLWMDKKKFKQHVVREKLANGAEVNHLEPALDMTVVIMHSIIEQLYLLGDFYTFMYYVSQSDETDIKELVERIQENHMTFAARVFVTLTKQIYQQAYGILPDKLEKTVKIFGEDKRERSSFCRHLVIPHRYSKRTLVRALFEKMTEAAFMKSVIKQVINIADPRMMKLVISELMYRRSRNTY